MIRTAGLLTLYLIILVLLTAPHTAWAGVDTTLVAKILGGEELSYPTEMGDENSKRLLDTMANAATKLLDQTNKDWNASSPQWKTIYGRVHADIDSEMPSIVAVIKNALKMQQAYETDIASHLSQSDVDAILAYYRTPGGQRYQEFMRRADKIVPLSPDDQVRAVLDPMSAAGVPSLFSKEAQQTATKPTPDEMSQYVRMLALSRMFQHTMALSQIAEAAHQDTTGYGGVGFIMGLAIKWNQQELEALDKEYAGDLAGFEAFTKTDAAQRFFAATGQAMPHLAEKNPLADSMVAVLKHEGEWKALYLAQKKP